jgi:hypothetical protein
MAAAQQYPVAAHEQQAVDAVERISTQGISETESELGVMAPPQDANPLKRGLVGCLSILDNLSIGGNNPAPGESTSGMTSPGRVSRRGAPKPEAGCSMQVGWRWTTCRCRSHPCPPATVCSFVLRISAGEGKALTATGP